MANNLKISQIVIFTVVAAALVFGITLLLQWRGTSSQSGNETGASTAPELLKVEDPTYPPMIDAKTAGIAPEYAWNKVASHAFWFKNVSGQEVEVGINDMQHCTCRSLAIGLAPQELSGAIDKWNALPRERQEEILKDVQWQELSKENIKADVPERRFKVPPGGAGWLRVVWKEVSPTLTSQLETKTFSGKLWTSTAKETGKVIDLATGCRFVNTVHVQTADSVPARKFFDTDLHFTDRQLSPGDQPLAEFICWSTLRKFDWEHDLKPIDARDVIWEKPQPLSEAELKEIGRLSFRKPVYGCHVRFRLKNLDLGHFFREFLLSRDPAVEMRITVEGFVQGPVLIKVRDPHKREDSVDLGLFKRTEGANETVFLECAQPETNLELDKLPDFLQVTLKPDPNTKNHWFLNVRMSVEKALDRPLGSFGHAHDVIVNLKVTQPGKDPQLLHIPVIGSITN